MTLSLTPPLRFDLNVYQSRSTPLCFDFSNSMANLHMHTYALLRIPDPVTFCDLPLSFGVLEF